MNVICNFMLGGANHTYRGLVTEPEDILVEPGITFADPSQKEQRLEDPPKTPPRSLNQSRDVSTAMYFDWTIPTLHVILIDLVRSYSWKRRGNARESLNSTKPFKDSYT